jgi:hypothetical protein
VVLAQRPPPVGQDPQHRQLLVISNPAQPSHPGCDQRDRLRIPKMGQTPHACRWGPA